MRILHVVNVSFVLPYYIGEQFDYFKAQGIEFHVACSPSAHLNEYANKKEFVAHPVKILRSINPVTDVISVIKLIRLIRTYKIDVVIGHTPKGGLLAMIASSIVRINKRIYFRHGLMYETSLGLKRTLLMLIEKLTGRLATKVICVSPSVLEISNNEGLSSGSKNFLLNKGTCNGVDINRFSRAAFTESYLLGLKGKYGILPGDKVIGYVGRLVNDKGINELMESWEVLTKKYKTAKLLLVGPFEERDSISEQMKTYISDNQSIIHTGLIDDVSAFYGLMDIFILPSYREGFPTVVLEASAMEIPVLTTTSTGCKDSIIDRNTGMFIDINSSDIVNKISYYLDNAEIAIQHGKNGRGHVIKDYAQEKIWKEIKYKVLEISK